MQNRGCFDSRFVLLVSNYLFILSTVTIALFVGLLITDVHILTMCLSTPSLLLYPLQLKGGGERGVLYSFKCISVKEGNVEAVSLSKRNFEQYRSSSSKFVEKL